MTARVTRVTLGSEGQRMHYVKIYSGINESSVAELDVHVRWLWIVLLTKADQYGNVFGTVQALARIANLSVEDTQDALNRLGAPDPSSTSPDEEGRRLIPAGQNLWHVVNYLKYRQMRDPEREKETARERMRKLRKRRRDVTLVTPDVTEGYDIVAVAVDVAVAEEKKSTDRPRKRTREEIPPPRDAVEAHVAEKGYHFNIDRWFAYYESNGWRVGKNRMKSWKGACLTWELNERGASPQQEDPLRAWIAEEQEKKGEGK